MQANVTLPVTGPRQPVWSYKAIHSSWLPLLGLVVHGKDHAAYQGQLLSALGLGAGQLESQGIPRSASVCLCLQAAY